MCDTQEGFAHTGQCCHRIGLALSYLAYRAMVDGNPAAEKMSSTILGLTQAEGIYDSFDPPEIRLLNAPFGSLSVRERVQTSWMVESVAVLAWMIGKTELPAFNIKANGAAISIALGIFATGTEEKISQSALRDPNEIEMAAVSYLALQWRMAKHFESPEKVDFAARLKDGDSPHLVADGFELRDGDLAVDGQPLSQLTEDRLHEIAGIVSARAKAFLWMLGYTERLSSVTAVN